MKKYTRFDNTSYKLGLVKYFQGIEIQVQYYYIHYFNLFNGSN